MLKKAQGRASFRMCLAAWQCRPQKREHVSQREPVTSCGVISCREKVITQASYPCGRSVGLCEAESWHLDPCSSAPAVVPPTPSTREGACPASGVRAPGRSSGLGRDHLPRPLVAPPPRRTGPGGPPACALHKPKATVERKELHDLT